MANFIRLICVFLLINVAIGKPITWDACAYDDNDCILLMMQSVKKLIAEGVPELGIPRLDPMQMDNIHARVPGFLDFYVKDSILKGPQTCVYDFARFDFEAKNATLAVQCNLAGRGHYVGTLEKPIMLGIPINNPITGNGTFALSLLNTRLLFDFKFELVKEDGVIYMRYVDGVTVYDVNYKGHAAVYSLSGLRNGNEDITEMANDAINKNWRVISSLFISAYIQETVNMFIKPELTYFLKMPASKFISSDLEPFLE